MHKERLIHILSYFGATERTQAIFPKCERKPKAVRTHTTRPHLYCWRTSSRIELNEFLRNTRFPTRHKKPSQVLGRDRTLAESYPISVPHRPLYSRSGKMQPLIVSESTNVLIAVSMYDRIICMWTVLYTMRLLRTRFRPTAQSR